MKLVVSLATRGRPEQLVDTIERNLHCLSLSDTVLMVQLDEDDEAVRSVVGPLASRDGRLLISIKPREDTVAAKWNRALAVPADLYMILGDDDPLVVPDTDQRVLDAAGIFPDGIGCVYGRMANASFPGILCVTKNLAGLMGWIVPEYFPYWFCDHWVDDIARMIGRIVFAEVQTNQNRAGITQEMREPSWWANWFDAAYLLRRQQAWSIISCLGEPFWLGQMLRTQHPLTEARSRYVNDTVRKTEAEGGFGYTKRNLLDERYQRVKAKAKAMVPEMIKDLPMEEKVQYEHLLLHSDIIVGLPKAWS